MTDATNPAAPTPEQILATARAYLDEFPGELLDEQWSATAYEIDTARVEGEPSMDWRTYHDAVARAMKAKEPATWTAPVDSTAFSARIKASGQASTVPDNAGAVDAEIYALDRRDGVRSELGEVTLLPDHAGQLSTWGSLDNWADDSLRTYLGSLESDDRREAISEIVDAVRRAAR